jgi:uncharacterized membrane protein (DUF4010 family)
MAQQSRTDARMVLPGQVATFLANTVMFVRVLVVTALIDRSIAAALAAPLGLMGAIMLAGAGWKQLALRNEDRGADPDGELVR